ncbi:phospholipase D-like domain-containing protein [Allorhizocola rhizosphaerae]|uniref:phospholipase D-like domain-containing protein n=1 Tax=Allorhizocola rhizosphaerae TaxID=1872709 RepID=UPI001B8ADFAC|nr:phospholipase D-like domain-containing protein [Allorhizocola rhizosphaerae]
MLALGIVSAPSSATAEVSATRTASAVIAGYPVWAHFTNPTSGRDYTIHHELERLIKSAPSGSTIRGAIHSLSIDWIADALVAAQNRGVKVLVVIDGKNLTSTDPSVATIRRLTNHKFCEYGESGHGCISTSQDGDMHTKMFTFTSTRDPHGVARGNVSWFGSANLTYASGTDAFNNAITVYGDAGLMNGLNANFTDMYNQRHFTGNDYYDAATNRGYYLSSAADVYASPEGTGQTDTIVNRLNDITPDAECRLRVGMASITAGRPELVNQVKRLKAGGCRVWMVVGDDGSGAISMNQAVYNDLLDAGVAIHKKNKVHDKFFLAYAKYDTAYRWRVYTGSQNWTQDALNENDEIFVKMAPESSSHPLYDGYYAHFNDAYNNGVACTKANYPCR